MSDESASYDAFISYASEDRDAAFEVCDRVEEAGLSCWIAPRNVHAGQDYGAEIIRGIEASNCIILVLSQRSNASKFVKAEVERAYAKGKTVFPVRVEGVMPAQHLELFVSSSHWIDAFQGNLDEHFGSLLAEITGLGGEGIVAADAPSTRVKRSKLGSSKLKTPLIATALVAVAAVAGLVWQMSKAPSISEPDTITAPITEKSVAVLPFRAISNGPDDEYFADGLTEEIINNLSQLPELLVTARTSAFYFKNKDLPIPEIASTLGVANIVEGSVRRDRDRLRITAQLIRATDGFNLWSETYDRTVEDSFAVQTDIAENAAAALNVILDDDRRTKMRATGIRDPQAFIAYQKGLELYDLAHGSEPLLEYLEEANTFFDQAIQRVPDFSDAYLFHTDYYSHLLLDIAAGRQIEGLSDDVIAGARAALQMNLDAALQHARDNSQRLNAAYDRSLITGDWQGLSTSLDRVLDDPGCATPIWPDASALPFHKADTALLRFQRLINCDPLWYQGREWELQTLIWLGEFEAAVETALVGMETAPHEALSYLHTLALIAAGQYDEAAATAKRHLRDEMTVMQTRIELAAGRGDANSGRALLETYRETFGIVSRDLIMYEALLGNRDEANRIAAAVDARPFGHMVLLLNIRNCYCGAPFDLDVAPNFASMLEDAALPWPPVSPINWSLKNW